MYIVADSASQYRLQGRVFVQNEVDLSTIIKSTHLNRLSAEASDFKCLCMRD